MYWNTSLCSDNILSSNKLGFKKTFRIRELTIAKDQNNLTASDCTQRLKWRFILYNSDLRNERTDLSQWMIFYHDVSPDCKTQCEPNGHSVNHQREVDMEQNYHSPNPTSLKNHKILLLKKGGGWRLYDKTL